MTASRRQIIIRRWISLIAYGLCAAFAWLFVDAAANPILLPFLHQFAKTGPNTIVVGSALLLAPILWGIGRRRWVGLAGIRNFLTYPPLWLSVVVAMLTLYTLSLVNPDVRDFAPSLHVLCSTASSSPAWFWVLMIVAIVLVIWIGHDTLASRIHVVQSRRGAWLPALASALPRSRILRLRRRIRETPTILRRWIQGLALHSPNGEKSGHAQFATDSFEREEFEELVGWLVDDREIDHPSRDRFGHDAVARRIANRLVFATGDPPTIALVGRIGSGKSTIRRLVAHHLKRHASTRLVDLSLWQFDSPETAVRGILRAVVDELAKHVNVLQIAGLPEEYLRVAMNAGTVWARLAAILHGERKPEILLRRVAEIASVIDLHIVVWIEDLERFSGSDRVLDGLGEISDTERLGPIRALLYLLDRCDCISVIVSDSSLDSRFDTEKISRFVEHPPRLDVSSVWRNVNMFRKACLGGYPKNIIYPVNPASREGSDAPEEIDFFRRWLRAVRFEQPEPLAALTMILDTPRSFKSALRLAHEVWKTMPGEIDLDDVLYASAIRVARPNIFSLIDEHIELFRQGATDPSSFETEKKQNHAVHKSLDKLLENETSQAEQNAIKALIKDIFPRFSPGESEPEARSVDRPQGLAECAPTDYWRRYLALPAISAEESDQGALRDIDAWKNRQSNQLVSRIAHPKRCAQIASFALRFDGADLCRLLAELARYLHNESAANWLERRQVPGAMRVYEMMQYRRPASASLEQTLEELIDRFTLSHLPLLFDICYLFATRSPSGPSLLDNEQMAAINAAFSRRFVNTFRSRTGGQLLEALRDGAPWLLCWICAPFSGSEGGQPRTPPSDDWQAIANVILDAAEGDPAKGIPYLVPFVTRGDYHIKANVPGRRSRAYVAEFDEDLARARFDFNRLVRILADCGDVGDSDEQITEQIRAAKAAAERFVSSDSIPRNVSNELG